MEILFLSKTPKLPSCFKELDTKLHLPLTISPPSTLTSKKALNQVMIYLDAAAFSLQKLKELVKTYGSKTWVGIYDAKGFVLDPSLFFLQGLSDYLGPQQVKLGLKAKRWQELFKLLPPRGKTKDAPPKSQGQELTPAALDWHDVQPGHEYSFGMLAVELDGAKDLQARFDNQHLKQIISYFQNALDQFFAPFKGRLWIWKDFGGIVLFPLSKGIQPVVASCIRFLLWRRILSVDLAQFKLLLSYRLVLLKGKTVYQERGKTGRIISDSINLLSHILGNFAKAGNFYLAAELFEELSPALAECFAPSGEYEDQKIYRLRLPAKF